MTQRQARLVGAWGASGQYASVKSAWRMNAMEAGTGGAAGPGGGAKADATPPDASTAGKSGAGEDGIAEIAVKRPDGGRGPDGLVAVGLDVGTGWVKVSALGRREMFPSLYSCTYAPSAGDDDMLKGGGGKGRPKAILRDAAGDAAAAMASGRYATLIRPVKHGVPHDGRGYSRLVAEGLRAVGIEDPGRAVVCAGVPYDSRGERDRIRQLVVAAVKPAYCLVVPQAYGTIRACGQKAGTVVNIGHGTTEIMRVGPEGMYGVSIQRASEFVLQQLAQRQGRRGRDAYTKYDKVLAEDPKMTARLVDLLAVHIADEVPQFSSGVGDSGLILSGGGSCMPGMPEALAKALGGAVNVRMVDEPSYSNAVGLELMARECFPKVSGKTAGKAGAGKAEPARQAASTREGSGSDGNGGVARLAQGGPSQAALGGGTGRHANAPSGQHEPDKGAPSSSPEAFGASGRNQGG